MTCPSAWSTPAPAVAFHPVPAGAERAAFDCCPVTEPVSAVRPEDYRRGLATGQYRPEWTWLAHRGDRVVARAVWRGDGSDPQVLECLSAAEDVDRVAVATALLAAGHRSFGCADLPGYVLRVPGQWRRHDRVREAVRWRSRAVTGCGLGVREERFHHVWAPHAGLPDAPAEMRLIATDRFAGTWSNAPEEASRAPAGQRRHLVGQVRDVLAGAAVVDHDPVQRHVRLVWFGVHPDRRGLGWGRELLAAITRHCADHAERISAWTTAEQHHSAWLLDSLGYRTTEAQLHFTSGIPHPATTPERSPQPW